MRGAFSCLLMAACAAPAARDAAAGPLPPSVVRFACWSLDLVAAATAVVADSPASWRTVREALGEAGDALPDDWCRFAIERAVVVTMPGALGGPVAVAEHEEEGVVVLTLTPQRAPSRRGLVVALVVPATAAQLAIVALLPDAGGELREATLAVFAGR